MDFWLNIAGIIAAGFSLAFISLVEAALVSVNRIRIRNLAEDGHPTAPIVERLIARPQELLGGLLVAINILVLLSANLTTIVARRQWGPDAVIFANAAVLLLLLLFGEVTPKTLSVAFAETIALRTARIAFVINWLLTPFAAVVNAIGFALLRALTFLHLLPGQVHPAPTAFSEDDIKQLVTAGEQSGEVETTEREMIHGVIEFADTAASAIMVPRTDLIALPADATLDEAIDAFISSGHSRVPVYAESIDNVIGLLYIKDLLIDLRAKRETPDKHIVLSALLRPALYVPESKKSDDLLREMQRKRVHMAIVVDEYGGTAGIITIEDLLEEIVGDIIDEYDQEEADVTELPDGTAIVNGRTSLEKIHDTFDIEIPEETEAETISGLITERLGRIPEVGDRVVIGSVAFSVTDVAHNRIERLNAVVLPDANPPAPPT